MTKLSLNAGIVRTLYPLVEICQDSFNLCSTLQGGWT